MSSKHNRETETKDPGFDMSACVEMMERMMGKGSPGCGCDPSAMMAQMGPDSGMDEFFTEIFSAVMAICAGEERKDMDVV